MINFEVMMEEDLSKALEVLRTGGIILYPTDTVWGIGCDATDAIAVSRIYALKKRADSKSMLAIVGDINQLKQWVESIPQKAFSLIEESERPVTIIYDTPHGIAQNLLAADGSVGIRISKDEFSSQLALRLNHPLVSTSANISGEPTPGYFSEISDEIINGVDYVCRHRRDDKTEVAPSCIAKINNNEITWIRQ